MKTPEYIYKKRFQHAHDSDDDDADDFKIKVYKSSTPKTPASLHKSPRFGGSNWRNLQAILLIIGVNCLLTFGYFSGVILYASPTPITPTISVHPLSSNVQISELKCSRESNAALNRGKHRLVENGTWRQKSARQVGAAKVCKNDWITPLPVIEPVYAVRTSIRKGANFTLAMYAHAGRLDMVEEQCKLWKGLPLIAVVYAPTVDGALLIYPHSVGAGETYRHITDLKAAAKELHATMVKQGKHACSLQIELVVESLCSILDPMPINSLRNRALRLVETEGVIIGDDEHLVNSLLAETLQDQRLLAQNITRYLNKSPGILIPSFDATNSWISDNLNRQLAYEMSSWKSKTGMMKFVTAGAKNDLPDDAKLPLVGGKGWGIRSGDLRKKYMATWVKYFHGFVGSSIKLGDEAYPHYIALASKVPYFDERIRGQFMASTLQFRQMEQLAQLESWPMLGDGWAMRLNKAYVELNNLATERRRKEIKNLVWSEFELMDNDQYVPVVSTDEACYNVKKP